MSHVTHACTMPLTWKSYVALLNHCTVYFVWFNCAQVLPIKYQTRDNKDRYSLLFLIYCFSVSVKRPMQTLFFLSTQAWNNRCTYLLQVSFRKRATNYRNFWQEMTYKDKASYASSPSDIMFSSRRHTHIFWIDWILRALMNTCTLFFVHYFLDKIVSSMSDMKHDIVFCTSDMTLGYVWQHSFLCATWFTHISAFVRHEADSILSF